MTKVGSVNAKGILQKLKLSFVNDFGRRNRSMVGARHLRNIISLNIVSTYVLLVRFGTSEKNSYFTLISQDGYLL